MQILRSAFVSDVRSVKRKLRRAERILSRLSIRTLSSNDPASMTRWPRCNLSSSLSRMKRSA